MNGFYLDFFKVTGIISMNKDFFAMDGSKGIDSSFNFTCVPIYLSRLILTGRSRPSQGSTTRATPSGDFS